MAAGEYNTGRYRLELERVLNSGTFHGAEAVCRLLTYLADKSLSGQGSGLKEFSIGVDAFNKPAGYDPQQDPTVRVLASKLRRKLDDYYRTEGAADPVRIEFPKGRYLLKFEDRESAAPPAVIRRRAVWAFAVVPAAVLALAVWWQSASRGKESAAARDWPPGLRLLWGSYVENDRPILIVFGTPLFARYSDGFLRDMRLNEWNEATRSGRVDAVRRAMESPSAAPFHGFTGIGEAYGALLLAQVLHPRPARLHMKRGATVSWEDVTGHNAIFLGSSEFIPLLKDLPFQQEFTIEGGTVRNLHPSPGEPESFPGIREPSGGRLLEDHALVTRLPGLHESGELTILASGSTEGVWAAAEYVTSPRHAAAVADRLRLPSGRLPSGYQVLVRARFKDQTPVATSYVTHRVLRSAH